MSQINQMITVEVSIRNAFLQMVSLQLLAEMVIRLFCGMLKQGEQSQQSEEGEGKISLLLIQQYYINFQQRRICVFMESQNKKINKKLNGHFRDVRSGCFSSDGTTLTSGSSDQSIRLLNVKTGQQKPNQMVIQMEFSQLISLLMVPHQLLVVQISLSVYGMLRQRKRFYRMMYVTKTFFFSQYSSLKGQTFYKMLTLIVQFLQFVNQFWKLKELQF
ncbi:unnamed protein product [Paramecium octaurelia]|uniref:Uncharacterized protein n=1 Tax=Paramecium octaurelia TaxID=43137 RepID=A0A8S1YKS1_PAROT|nr:unnamed protein product [Paramecium octaurelia]